MKKRSNRSRRKAAVSAIDRIVADATKKRQAMRETTKRLTAASGRQGKESYASAAALAVDRLADQAASIRQALMGSGQALADYTQMMSDVTQAALTGWTTLLGETQLIFAKSLATSLESFGTGEYGKKASR